MSSIRRERSLRLTNRSLGAAAVGAAAVGAAAVLDAAAAGAAAPVAAAVVAAAASPGEVAATAEWGSKPADKSEPLAG